MARGGGARVGRAGRVSVRSPALDASRVPELLSAAAGGRGDASIAVIERADARPVAWWTPGSEPEPAFLAYSITKTFTAALVLQLCEAGRLGLDDRLTTWLPRIDRAERIRVRQLLNHTAGIPDYGANRAYHDELRSSPATPWSFERFGEETFDRGLRFEPGQGWAYSNPGYMLLRRIVEEVSGTSYRALISERVVRPLGLERTFVAESIDDLAALAPGTSRALSLDGTPRDVRACYHPGWVSHGVVASTASDVARFLDALFGGALLSRASVARMLELVALPAESPAAAPEPAPPSRWRRPSYGLGLMADPASPWGLIAGHNGGGPGYAASAFHAFELGGATVCAMGGIEDAFSAEGLVFDIFDRLAMPRDRSPRRT